METIKSADAASFITTRRTIIWGTLGGAGGGAGGGTTTGTTTTGAGVTTTGAATAGFGVAGVAAEIVTVAAAAGMTTDLAGSGNTSEDRTTVCFLALEYSDLVIDVGSAMLPTPLVTAKAPIKPKDLVINLSYLCIVSTALSNNSFTY